MTIFQKIGHKGVKKMGHFLHKLPQIPATLLAFARFGRNDGWAGRGAELLATVHCVLATCTAGSGAERLFSVFLSLACDLPQIFGGL